MIHLTDPARAIGFDRTHLNAVFINKDPEKCIERSTVTRPRFVIIIGTQRRAPGAFPQVDRTPEVVANKTLIAARLAARAHWPGSFYHMRIRLYSQLDLVLVKKR